MGNKVLTVLVFVLSVQLATAQTDSLKQNHRYFSTFLSGALIGCGNCSNGKDFTFSFVTMHGVEFKSGIKLAAGLGLDTYYDWRLFPVVIGITFDKETKPNAVYFHVNAGHAFGRYLLANPYEEDFITSRGGFTINPMVGFRIGNEKIRLYVQAGYKFQKASFTIDYSEFYKYSRDYEMGRFVVQMGFGLN